MITLGIIPKIRDNRYVLSRFLLDRLAACHACVLPILSVDMFPKCDGFILAGGNDIDPVRYHAAVHEKTILEDSFIEHLEFACVDYCQRQQLPLLGICRGMQVIGVYFGSELIQHIEHHSALWHPITVYDQRLLKKDTPVYSDHHQSVKTLPQGFLLCAEAKDGTIEAIRKDMMIAVQWHPEFDEKDTLLPLFLQHVAANKIHQQQD